MNRLSVERKAEAINCLVEGNSIRSTERLTGIHRDTVMRLMVEVGEGCARIMDEKMREVQSKRIQVDEIWSYVRKKQVHLQPGENVRAGDFWTWVALDPDTKLVPCYRVSKRKVGDAIEFMADLHSRLANRVQLSSDGLHSYIRAVEQSFGADVDYGQVVKFYDAVPVGPGRYAPPKVVKTTRDVIMGAMDKHEISTSLVERQKPDHAYANAPVHQIDQWLLEEAGEPEGGGCPAFLPLQFRAPSRDHARHASNGGGSE